MCRVRRSDEQRFAIKVILKERTTEAQMYCHQVRALTEVDHVAIIKLVDWFEIEEKYVEMRTASAAHPSLPAVCGEKVRAVCTPGRPEGKGTNGLSVQTVRGDGASDRRRAVWQNSAAGNLALHSSLAVPP